MPAPSRTIDRSFALMALIITVLLLVPKLFQHAAIHTGDMDTGNYSNLAWALGHGEGFTGSVTGRHHLGEHFSPIMLLVAPVYWVWASAYVLMILQALATAGTIVLVLRLFDGLMEPASCHPERSEGSRTPINSEIPRCARDDMLAADGRSERFPRMLGTALLLVLFLFYPPLLATWRTQFQPIELGMPLVVLAIMLMHARRDGWLSVVVALLLCTRESAPLAALGLAIYSGLALRRWRLAMLLAIVAGAWAGITMGVLMPHFRAGARWPHARWIDPAAMWDRKLLYLATMLLSFGPLPFLSRSARAATAAAIPGMILNLLVARQTQLTFVGHYDAQTAPFLMIAAAHGMVTLLRCSGEWSRLARRSAFASPLVLCITFFAITNSKTPFQLLHDWWPTRTRLALATEARAMAQQFADAPALSAWANIGPQVCHRPHYVGMRAGATSESFEEWSARLPTGAILLVPTAAYPDKEAALTRELIRASPHAQLAREGKLVEAFVWNKSEIRSTKSETTRKARKKK